MIIDRVVFSTCLVCNEFSPSYPFIVAPTVALPDGSLKNRVETFRNWIRKNSNYQIVLTPENLYFEKR